MSKCKDYQIMEKDNKKAYGICLGASTISAVQIVCANNNHKPEISIGKTFVKAHEGNPRVIFEQVLKEIGIQHNEPVLITGRKFRKSLKLDSITEPEAVEYSLEFLKQRNKKRYDALVSAGGETFMAYTLDKNHKISGIATGNKCAAGTGEFFLQQIRRMNLDVNKAIHLAVKGDPYPVSGRCSVFCKSDCTHALNKGEPISNVTAGLCKMVAQKIIELLKRMSHKKILVVGGTALNRAVINHLKDNIEEVDVPEEAPYFEALGAALAALHKGKALSENLFCKEHTSFSFLPPLKEFESYVTFHSIQYGKAKTGDRCLIGLDVGSTTTKAVLLRVEDKSILGSVYLRTNGNPIEASRLCFKGLQETIGDKKIEIFGIGVTGSGRQITGLYILTDGIINEIIAHASAAVYFNPEVDTIFEIGGQDAKYTYIINSVASDYAMNQACSAGTGSFLEESALEVLGIKMEDIAGLAVKGENPPNFNDQCAAFISSDIKNAIHERIELNDILAGLVYSICFNYINRVKGNRPVGKKIFMQGGVCYNRAIPLAMAGILKTSIVIPPEPGLMGAFGVALELEKRINLGIVKQKQYILKEIIERKITYEKPFTCAGGKEKCDLKCHITRIRIEGDIHPFGGACNRYYNLRFKKKVNTESLDYLKKRNNLVFGKYAKSRRIIPGTPVIGLNTSFLTLTLFPLYYNFFSHLGCKIVTPDEVAPGAVNYLVTSMCYPAEISIGLLKSLVQKNPDYIFIPFVKELYVPNGINKQDFCCTCGFSRGEGFILQQAFHDQDFAQKILTPYVNFNGGWELGRKAFVTTAKRIGFTEKAAHKAYTEAVKAQYAFEAECKSIGCEVLEHLKKNPETTAVVLFGRSYNAFTPEANKGVEKKLASRDKLIIPYDMLPYDEESLTGDFAEYMTWEAGQKLLRTARLVKKNPQLFGVFITNFLCAPDSFIVPYFRRVMGTKPSLTLEFDAHTADAGINTRLEAFLDIVDNYRKVQKQMKSKKNTFRIAEIKYEQSGAAYYDSNGKRFKLTDPHIKIIVPPLGHFGSRGLAAVFRRMGINSEALPPADGEVLRLGRSVTTGKECLPLIVCIGALVRYLKYRKPADEKQKLCLLIPKAPGYCRLGQYHVHINQFIKDNKLKDIAILDLSVEQSCVGMGTTVLFNAWKSIVITDVIDDIECSILALAKDPVYGIKVFNEECEKICLALEGKSPVNLYTQLKKTAERLKEIPLKQSYDETARITITGEFFVRIDPFSNLKIAERLASQGFLVSIASLTEIMYQANFLIKKGIKKPNHTISSWLEFIISEKTQTYVEKKIKKILARSGLYEAEFMDIVSIVRHSEFIIPNEIDGEPSLIVGITMRDGLSKYCGVVNIGPFGCMQTRFGDAITIPQANVKGKKLSYAHTGKTFDMPVFQDDERIPFLSIESDGNPYPQLLDARFESFCLQAKRIALKQGKNVAQ